jgi:hypothetical protein
MVTVKQERQCMCNITMRHVCVTIVAMEKQQVLHIQGVCVSVAVVIQHAKCICCITLSSVPCPALPYFSTSHTQHDFQNKFTEHKMRALIFSAIFVRTISHSKKNSGRYHKCTQLFT